MIDDVVLVSVDIVDVAATARQLFGNNMNLEQLLGRPVPENDFRFQITEPHSGAVTTFGCNDTASDVIAALKTFGRISAA